MNLASRVIRRSGGRVSNRKAYAQTFEDLARGRIKQCEVCEQTTIWRGFVHALLAGWSWSLGAKRLVWRCAGCGPLALLCALALALLGCSRDVEIVDAGGAGGSGGSSSSSGESDPVHFHFATSSSSTGEPYCIAAPMCFSKDGAPCKTNISAPIDNGTCSGGNCCTGAP